MIAEQSFEETYERALLDHVPLCYSVALALTRNPADAHSLAREAILAAWQSRNASESLETIKNRLLSIVRRLFLQRAKCKQN